MNKEQIKDEIILTVKNAIHYSSLGDYGVPLHDNDVDNVAEDVAEELYNLGYRKMFTSDLASEKQQAFKEGYERAKEELLESGELVTVEWHDEQVLHAESEIKRLQSENKTLRLAKDDFKKRFKDSGHRNKKLSLKNNFLKKDIRKTKLEAVKEFAERCKEYARACKASGFDGIGESDIDELLKEYDNGN